MKIEHQIFQEERALYSARGLSLSGCRFEGEEDGESALKESADILCEETLFALRYPLWHASRIVLRNSKMTETCRAPLWYVKDALIENSTLLSPKAIRECENIRLHNTAITSEELGWFSSGIYVKDCDITGAYAFLHARELTAEGLRFEGKYSFQYLENAHISHAHLKTKDAFWHAKHVTVTDSVIEGEYLGWYARDLRLVRCHIKGTQPLCYAEELYLEDCTMEGCDLAFEKSTVHADIRGRVESIKAPADGEITLDEVGSILPENDGAPGSARIRVRSAV